MQSLDSPFFDVYDRFSLYKCKQLQLFKLAHLTVYRRFPPYQDMVKHPLVMLSTRILPLLKRKELLTPAATRMNLEDMMLSEISQTQKDKHDLIPLIAGP